MAGSNPGMLIRIAANLDDLRKNLAESRSQIEVTTAGMAKLAASLDSGPLIQRAHNIVAAINQVGVATLTTAQAATQLSVLDRAMEKLSLTSKPIPADMTATADSLRKIAATADTSAKSTESWKSQLSGLAGAFGVAFSVGAVVNFGKELLKMGDEIVRVHDRTGLTIKEVQQFTYVAGQSGNTIDELTGAIGQMQNRLASGDKSAVAAVKFLHINFQELIAASPAKQMELIATEIAKIPDPAQRTALAMDLFGKTGTAILPTLTSQFSKLAAEAPVMSDSTVRALDTAGDRLGHFGLQIKVWAAESYNYLSSGFNKMIAACYLGVAAFLDMEGKVVGLTSKIPGAATVLGALGVSVKSVAADAQWFRDAAGAMAAKTDVATEAAKRLAPALYDGGKAAKEAGAAATTHAEALKKSAEELKKHAQELEKDYVRLAAALTANPEKVMADNWEKAEAVLKAATAKAQKDMLDFIDVLKQVGPAMSQEIPIPRFFDQIPMASINAARAAQDGMIGVFKEIGQQIPAALTPPQGGFAGAFAGIMPEVSKLARSFEQLANISGGSFGGIAKDIGTVIGSMDLATTAGTTYKTGLDQIHAGHGQTAAGVANVATAVVGMASSFMAATEHGNTAQKALGGMATGAAAGGQIFPVFGAAIGAVVGGLGGLIRGLFGASEAQKELNKTTKDLAAAMKTGLAGLGSVESTNEIRKLELELIKTHGSLDNIAKAGGAAGQALVAAWGSASQEGLAHFKELLGEFNKDLEHTKAITDLYNDVLGTDQLAALLNIEEVWHKLTPEQLANDAILGNLITKYEGLREATGNTIPGLEEMAQAWDHDSEAAKRHDDQLTRSAGSFGGLTDAMDIFQAKIGNVEAVDKFKNALEDVRKTGKYSFGDLTGMYQTLRGSLGNTAEITRLGELLMASARTGVFEFDAFNAVFTSIRDEAGKGIQIPVSFTGNAAAVAMVGGKVDESQRAYLEAHIQGVGIRRSDSGELEYFSKDGRAGSAAQAEFLNNNPGDVTRAEKAVGTSGQIEASLAGQGSVGTGGGGFRSVEDDERNRGYPGGTPGLGFVDFGVGTRTTLHGREAVVPEGKASDFAAKHTDFGVMDKRLASIERLLTTFPFVLAATTKSAMAKR